MDPVTHVLAAATAAVISAPPEIEPWAAGASVFGALAPDIDFLSRRLGHLGLLRFHHTATHSAVGDLFFAALAAAGAALAGGPWPWVALFASLGFLTHVGLDLLLHSSGLMLAWPFSRRMVRGGLFLGLNPFTSSARCGERRLTVCLRCQARSVVFNRVFFILAATALAAAAAWHSRRIVFAAGAALLLLYVLRRTWQKSRAAALARKELGPHARVFPAAFGGARWLAVAPREAGCVTAVVDLKAPALSKPREHVPAPADLAAASAARPAVQAFTESAIFPFAAPSPEGPGVWWIDLSYDFAGSVQLHTLKIRLDPAGAVTSEEFRERW